MDDRMALINTGRDQIMLAMRANDELEKRELLRLEANNLLLEKSRLVLRLLDV